MFLSSPLSSIRQWLTKPKRDEKQALNNFYYADDALHTIVTCLDAWSGHGTCEALVDRLRIGQQELLAATERVIEAIGMRRQLHTRDYRLKFPDDVQDELGFFYAPLWFGAECLAAGSTIANKEAESEQLRPTAINLCRKIEEMRVVLRKQAIEAPHCYTPEVVNAILAFDAAWVAFEAGYVRCWVAVKTPEEVEQQHNVVAMFSEAVLRAIDNGNMTHDMMEGCDPGLMLAIPRLSLVWGLRITDALPTDDASCPYLFKSCITRLRALKEALEPLSDDQVAAVERTICQSLHAPDHDEPHPARRSSLGLSEESKAHSAIVPSLALRSTPLGGPVAGVTRKPVPDTRPIHEVAATSREPAAHDATMAPSATIRSQAPPDGDGNHTVVEDYFSPPSRDTMLNIGHVLSNAMARTASLDCVEEQRPATDSEPAIECSMPPPNNDVALVHEDQELRCGHISAISSEHLNRLLSASEPDRPHAVSATTSTNATCNTTPCDSPAMSPEADRKTPVLNDNNAGIAPEDFTVEQCNTDICGVVSDSISNPSDALPATAQQSHHESEGSAGDDLDETLIHTLFVEIAAVADQLQSGSYAKDMRYMLKLIFEMYSTTTAETTNDDKISLDFSQSPSGSATPSANESQRTRAMDASLAQDALLAQRTTSISSNQASATGLRDPMGSTLIMRPSWKHDDDAPICTRCGLSFTVIRRRHHCRACGEVFCGYCASSYAKLPQLGYDTQVRVCAKCKQVHGRQKS